MNQAPRDCRSREPCRDFAQVWARAVVSRFTDAVTGKAPGLRGHGSPKLVFGQLPTVGADDIRWWFDRQRRRTSSQRWVFDGPLIGP
jgi:hypothetical protein